jgi:hypothetical protein
MASETRIEYRVVGAQPRKRQITIWGPITDRAEAERAYASYRKGGVYFDVGFETRTVTETPWVDAAEEPHTDG